MKSLRPLLRPLAVMIAAAGASASAQTSGVWINPANGSWGLDTNWQGASIASGVDALADFSTIDITAATTVTLDGPRTVGSLKFGDAGTASSDWTLAGDATTPLTLDVSNGAASINVVNRTATISAVLTGNDGINVSGSGVLALTGANTFTGKLIVASGSTLSIGAVGAMGATGAGNETVVSSGGVLNVATVGAAQINYGTETILVSGTGINNAGAIISTGGQTSTLQNITLTGATTFGGTARFNINGGKLDLGGFKLTKVGANQIALTNNLNITDGDIDITAGILSFEANASLKGSGTVTVSSGAVLGLWANVAGSQTRQVALNAGAIIRELGSPNANSTFNSPIRLQGNSTVDVQLNGNGVTNLTLAGGITESGGSFGFTRTGPGKLTIGGANTFTGPMNLNTGTTYLAAGATLATNAINIASGAVFDTSAAGGFTLASGKTLTAGRTGAAPASDVVGAFNADAGSNISVGGTAARTLTFGNDLTLGGASLTYDLGGDTTVGGGVNDLIAVTGNLTLGGTNTIALRTVGAAPAPGVYTLLTYTGALTGGAANFAITVPATIRQTYTPDTTSTPNAVLLQVAGSAANLTWNGGGANTWDLNSTANFTDGAAQKFFNLDTVNFNDGGSNSPAVNITGVLQPAAVNVIADQNYTFGGTGVLSGGMALTKSGSGVLTIAGTGHDFTGGVNFVSGTVSIAAINNAGLPSALGNGPLNFTGGALEYIGANASTDRVLALGTGGGALSIADAATTLTLTSSPTGAGRFTKAGPGTLLANYTGAYTGGTVIAAGTLRLANTNALGANGSLVTISDGATLEVNGQTPVNKIVLTISGAGVDGLGALRNSGAAVINNNIATSITLAGDTTIGTNSRYDFVGGITFIGGNFTLTKVGTGETWWAPNSGATIGNIVVNGGRFGVQSSNNLGSAAYSITVNPGAQLSTYNTASNTKPIVLNSGSLHNNSAAPVAGTTATWNGTLTLQGAGVTNKIDTFGGPIVLNGKVMGAGGFEKLNTGGTLYRVDLGSPDNDYLGDTQVTGGTLRLVGSGRISPASALVMNGATATFDGGGAAQTITGLRGSAGTVTNVALTVDSSGEDTFAGQLTGASTSLTKNGSGSLTLSSAAGNTYGGATTVNAGTLLVNGGISGSATTVNGGVLGGSGAVGSLTLNSGGAVAPGAGGIGALTAATLLWNGGGSLLFELGGDGSSDQISLSSGVFDKGSGSGFLFDFLGTGAPDTTYTLATFGSTDFIAADFSFRNLGAQGGSFKISGNSLQFVTIPEPSSAQTLLAGLSGLAGLGRWRRRTGARS